MQLLLSLVLRLRTLREMDNRDKSCGKRTACAAWFLLLSSRKIECNKANNKSLLTIYRQGTVFRHHFLLLTQQFSSKMTLLRLKISYFEFWNSQLVVGRRPFRLTTELTHHCRHRLDWLDRREKIMYVLLSFDKQTSAPCSYVTFAASRNELLHTLKHWVILTIV